MEKQKLDVTLFDMDASHRRVSFPLFTKPLPAGSELGLTPQH